MTAASSRFRTTFQVRLVDGKKIEVIEGDRHPWHFRVHYHLGNELAHITKGRARLRLASGSTDVEAGDTVLIPAGTLHRFEPLDVEGWAFRSEFHLGAEIIWDEVGGPIVERVTNQLSARHTLQTDLASVAAGCAVSAGHLARVFRSDVGTSVHNFHVLLAIHKAKTLLKEQSPVVDAALDAGFFDQAHFTREFVRMAGLTPGLFRHAWATVS